MSTNIISQILVDIKSTITLPIAENLAAITHVISPTFMATITLYIIYVAYEIVYSERDVFMRDVVKTIGAFAVVSAFTFNGDLYVKYVIPFVLNSGDDLSAAVLKGSGGDVANSIDMMWQSLSSTMNKFYMKSAGALSVTDLGDWIFIAMTYGAGMIGGAALVVLSGAYLALATFMTGILLSVGVIFICFSLFKSTRSMFNAWCGLCLNYILINVLYTISFSFLIAMLEKYAVLENGVTSSGVWAMFFTIFISLYLIDQIGTACSNLTGGVGINGLTNVANRAASFATRNSGKAAMAAGSGAAATAAGARRFIERHAAQGRIVSG